VSLSSNGRDWQDKLCSPNLIDGTEEAFIDISGDAHAIGRVRFIRICPLDWKINCDASDGETLLISELASCTMRMAVIVDKSLEEDEDDSALVDVKGTLYYIHINTNYFVLIFI
jgi:hypothetical protein